jgi:hypothetical protein
MQNAHLGNLFPDKSDAAPGPVAEYRQGEPHRTRMAPTKRRGNTIQSYRRTHVAFLVQKAVEGFPGQSFSGGGKYCFSSFSSFALHWASKFKMSPDTMSPDTMSPDTKNARQTRNFCSIRGVPPGQGAKPSLQSRASGSTRAIHLSNRDLIRSGQDQVRTGQLFPVGSLAGSCSAPGRSGWVSLNRFAKKATVGSKPGSFCWPENCGKRARNSLGTYK